MSTLKQSAQLAIIFVGLLWSIKVLELLLWLDLSFLGLVPRGDAYFQLITAPLIHGSVPHLAANSLPLVVLGTIVLFGFPASRWWAVAIIWLVSGVGVWLFGRPSIHLGASGLVHGLFFFVLAISVFRRDFRSVGLMLLAVLLYGGLIWGIFPQQPGISYEYHLFGAVGGVFSAWLLRAKDPMPERKRYSWELEAEQQLDHEREQARDYDNQR